MTHIRILFRLCLLAAPLAFSGCTDPPGGASAVATRATVAEPAAPHVSGTGRASAPSPVSHSTLSQTATRSPSASRAGTDRKPPSAPKWTTGENPDLAREKGWPVHYPAPLPGALLPGTRIVAYYGNPYSKKMGVLGEFPKDEMLRRLRREVVRWEAADPATPVRPALHLIAVVAQNEPGPSGKYRMVMPDSVVNNVYSWAREAKAQLFIDIQTGHDDLRNLLPRFAWLLKNPDVHLGIDPEFNLIKSGARPGSKIGTYDARDVNYATGYLKELVRRYNLPPKVLVVHRFTRNGLTNFREIQLLPEVQIIINMDGWGAPWLKRSTYQDYVVSEPVQFTGFKLFYHNDTKKGQPLLTPREVLRLRPQPIYIQYQ